MDKGSTLAAGNKLVARAFFICALPPTLAAVAGFVSKLGTFSKGSEKPGTGGDVGPVMPLTTVFFQNIFFVAYPFCSPNLTAQNIIFVAHPNCSPNLNAQNILFVAHEC